MRQNRFVIDAKNKKKTFVSAPFNGEYFTAILIPLILLSLFRVFSVDFFYNVINIIIIIILVLLLSAFC